MLDPSHLLHHLGNAAILVIALLGNAGVPAPEESVLVLDGCLAWHGRLHLPLVVIVGVVSASLGDWIEQLRRALGLKEDVALYAAILALAGVAFIVMAWTRRREAVDPSAP